MKEFENDVRYDWLQQAEKEKRDYQSYWKEKSVELFNQNEKIKELLREFKRLQKEGNQNIQISDLRNNVNVFDIALLDECL